MCLCFSGTFTTMSESAFFFFRYMFHFCFREKVRITPWFCTQIKWQWFKIYFSVSCDKLFLKTKQKAKTKTKPLHSSFWVFFSLVTKDCFPEHSNENLPNITCICKWKDGRICSFSFKITEYCTMETSLKTIFFPIAGNLFVFCGHWEGQTGLTCMGDLCEIFV